MPVRDQQIHLIIPAGTKVVSRTDGRVGVVVHSPASLEHTYRVRFAEGTESSYSRQELTIYRQDQSLIPGGANPADLFKFVAYRCIVGSTAYGLANRGI